MTELMIDWQEVYFTTGEGMACSSETCFRCGYPRYTEWSGAQNDGLAMEVTRFDTDDEAELWVCNECILIIMVGQFPELLGGVVAEQKIA